MSVLWLNGSLYSNDDATISAFDHGITVGDGVFESVGVWAGTPFALGRHLDRLVRSATGLGLPPPPVAEIRAASAAVLEANSVDDGKLRITVTAGPGPLGSGRSDGAATVMVAVSPLTPWPATTAVVTAPWTRNERSAVAGLKTTSYAENVRALAFANERGGSEALLANTRGELCEGTGSNIFLVMAGELVTPPLESGCLAGVMRALLCERLPVGQDPLPIEALRSCDEAFLTSATRKVHPIDRIDDRGLDPCPGPCTLSAAAVLAELMAAESEP